MGLHANIFKTPLFTRGSNGGLSEHFNDVVVVNIEGPATPTNNAPPVLLVQNGRGMVRMVPAMLNDNDQWVPETGWHMMGGAYVGCCDSRFTEAVEKLTGAPFYGAVALHDRVER